MDFKLTEEQEMLRDMIRSFAENEVKPIAAEIDRTHEFPMENIKKLGEMGIMGVVYDEKYNGAGMDYSCRGAFTSLCFNWCYRFCS